MITRTRRTSATSPAWRDALRGAFSRVGELLDHLGLDAETVAALVVDRSGDSGDGGDAGDREAAAILRAFPLRVPRAFVERMSPGDPRDPLLLQVLPHRLEAAPTPGYSADPLAEHGVSPVPGVLQKYRHRVLLVVTGACAVHCRYCFRRHFPYSEHIADWSPALRYIAGSRSVEEVILSGGDPLVIADERLADLAAEIAKMPHIRRFRIHTRLPIVLPERVDAALIAWLSAVPGPVVVLHANHAREIDGAVARAVGRLCAAGVTVLNQAVLLRGVNDSVRDLVDLSKTLFEAGVMPYYLHMLDRVHGAAHFEVPETVARDLVRDIQAELPGYLVPKLVREHAGAPSKTPIDLQLC